MGYYVDWNDVEPHIDKSVAEPGGRTVDLEKVDASIAYAEAKFDNLLRKQWQVPFDEDLYPEAYDFAQQITSRWAAAWYLLNSRQSEVSEETATWYADRLTEAADALFDVFFEGTPPDDTPASGDEYTELIADGYSSLTDTEQDNLEPAFARAHLPGRSNPW